MRTFAIGDIHGCHQLLLRLLQAIRPGVTDTLIFLGDLIDRGPGSQQVLDIIMQYQSRCQVIVILGNHEEMMLDSRHGQEALNFWLKYGGIQALQSFGVSADAAGLTQVPQVYFDFLRQCRLFYQTDDFYFCHATPDPDKPLMAQPMAMRWRHMQRADHALRWGKPLICGHTEQRNGRVLQQYGIIGIDTYAYGGGRLTAIQVSDETGQRLDPLEIWQVDQALQLHRDHLPLPVIAAV